MAATWEKVDDDWYEERVPIRYKTFEMADTVLRALKHGEEIKVVKVVT